MKQNTVTRIIDYDFSENWVRRTEQDTHGSGWGLILIKTIQHQNRETSIFLQFVYLFMSEAPSRTC